MESGGWIEPNPRFRDDGHSWVYTQGDARRRARASSWYLFSFGWHCLLYSQRCRGSQIAGLRWHVVRISPAGTKNRGILHGSNHWMRSFRSTSQSAHTHAHAPQRACKSLLIAMWNHLHLIIPAHLHGNARESMSNLLLIPWITTVNRGFPVRFVVCYIYTGLGRILFLKLYLLWW